ncbi:MAG: hypothetical protein FJ137_15385 [Deltaproteobacteria bacterium]|nr:hypothetical protein [Deltaproteobacteria bacterium]
MMAVVPAGLLSGCLFGGGAELRDNRFEDAHVGYAVGLPGDGWQRVRVATANGAWFDEQNGAALLVNSHCEGVRDAPLEGLALELMIGTTERAVQEQRVLPFDGREALEMVTTGKLDGVERQRALFVLKKDGCVYDIVYDAPPATFATGLPAYRRVRDGMVVGPRRDRR